MDDFVEVSIPENIEHQNEEFLRRYFQERLEEIGHGFSEALDLACDQRTSHAILDCVTINRVLVLGDSMKIGYRVELSEFQACKDVIACHSFDRTVIGKRFGHDWRFKKHVLIPERSTNDEL